MSKKLFIIIVSFSFFPSLFLGQITIKKEISDSELNSLKIEFEELSNRKDVEKAVYKGALLSELFVLSKKYREASTINIQMDNLIYPFERQTGKTAFSLRFLVSKERLRLFTQEQNYQKSKTQFDIMNYCMRYMNDNPYEEDALLVKAEYFHTFGMKDKSLETYDQLLQRCLSVKIDNEKEDCFKNLIAYADQYNNTELEQVIQAKYTVWQDSVQLVKAAKELEILKLEHELLLTDLELKENAIRNNKTVIAGLWVFIVAVISSIVVLLFLYFRSIYRIRKLNSNLKMANESNVNKSKFISNIEFQIMPSLDDIERNLDHPSSIPAMKEKLILLKKNITDMQTYISLEEKLEETYTVKDTDISQFCQRLMDKTKTGVSDGVECIVSAPRVSIKTNTQALEKILGYLLSRSAMHTESGKIMLEFKKRNARTGQFIITDTGLAVDPNLQEEVFKPFGVIDPAMENDRWGLPICKLIAHRLNGTLKIDPEYKRGTRFILDFCS